MDPFVINKMILQLLTKLHENVDLQIEGHHLKDKDKKIIPYFFIVTDCVNAANSFRSLYLSWKIQLKEKDQKKNHVKTCKPGEETLKKKIHTGAASFNMQGMMINRHNK